MSGDLHGKVAVVTGGAQGLGRAMAELFVAHGARVVIADVDRATGEAAAAEIGASARFHPADVTDPDQIEALLDAAEAAFGPVDVMVNNAAVSAEMHPRFLDETFNEFDRVLRVDLLGVMLGTQRAARRMARRGGGAIVNISSTSGLVPSFGVICYRTAKAAVIQLTKAAAIDLAEYGIRVNAIAPGNIATGMNAFSPEGVDPNDPDWRRYLDSVRNAAQPLKRKGTPRDVAEAALYLASDRAAQVTGTVLPVDGGITAGDAVNQLQAIIDARTNYGSDRGG